MKNKVFVNHINKNIKNNEESYHYKGNNNNSIYHFDNNDVDMIDVSKIDVRSKLNELFSSDSFVYKSSAILSLKDGNTINEEIIAMKDNNLITLSNKKIPINEIIDIKKA